MDTRIRVAVTADICCECVRNAAYYQSGWQSSKKLITGKLDFWTNLNGNFLDIAVLSWCYLFGDGKSQFRWEHLFQNAAVLLNELYAQTDLKELALSDYIEMMRRYRDKLVAHRDIYLTGDPRITYPDLTIAVDTSCFLYEKLVRDYSGMFDHDTIPDLRAFYDSRFAVGKDEYLQKMKE